MALAAEESEAQLRFVYAVGRVHGAEYPVVEVWPVGKVLAHRQRFNKVGERHYSYENLEMYARKVALLQVLKYMPKSVELQNAVSLEHNVGEQHLDIQEIAGAATALGGDGHDAGPGTIGFFFERAGHERPARI